MYNFEVSLLVCVVFWDCNICVEIEVEFDEVGKVIYVELC